MLSRGAEVLTLVILTARAGAAVGRVRHRPPRDPRLYGRFGHRDRRKTTARAPGPGVVHSPAGADGRADLRGLVGRDGRPGTGPGADLLELRPPVRERPLEAGAARLREGPRLELRAGRRGGGVPALPPVHPRPPPRPAALEPAHLGRAPLPGQRAVGDLLAVQLALVRAAVLVVAGGGGGAQAVPRRVRYLRAGARARHALRGRAAGRARVRVRHVLHRLAVVAADEHIQIGRAS